MKKIEKIKYLTENIDKAIKEGTRIEGLSYEHYLMMRDMAPLIDKINEIIEALNETETEKEKGE